MFGALTWSPCVHAVLLLLLLGATCIQGHCPAANNEYVRFVRIGWSGCANATDAFLSLAELRYLHKGWNVALKKPTSSSGDLGKFTSKQAVDGSVSTIYQSNSIGLEAFWEVDLQVLCDCCTADAPDPLDIFYS
jgi:hypothetical protein